MEIRNGMRPERPGEILRDEIDVAGMSEGALSKALDVPLNRVTMILEGRQGITADTALRLARYFGTTPQLWLNLQQTWELRRAEIEVGRQIAKRVTARQSAAQPGLYCCGLTTRGLEGAVSYSETAIDPT